MLLASLFIVSGISGSKVSDMATVAPALFPEMRRRGNKQPEMVALLATGAAMADTVPPSIVLIVLGSVAGVSIAGLFESGFVVAMVLLLALLEQYVVSGTRRRSTYCCLTDRASFLDADQATWSRLFDVNARAPFFLMQAAIQAMRERGQGGAIVNIISINAHCGAPDLAVYSATKGALAC